MVIFIANFYANYVNFPKADCGFCGSPSCVSALRKFCLGEMSLGDCIYFKAGYYREEDFKSVPVVVSSVWGRQPGISLVMPCMIDPKKTAMYAFLSHPENLKYGFFDMVTADKIFQYNVPGMGFSPSLGICRIERDSRSAEGVANGELLARLALDKEDALWQLSRLTRWLWAAVN